MTRSLYLVLSNPLGGQEREYHEWYTERHLPEIVQVPGFVSAQRFRLGSVRRGPDPYPYGYLAAYDIAGDPAEAFDALGHAQRTHMTRPAGLDLDQHALVFEPITPRITGDGGAHPARSS